MILRLTADGHRDETFGTDGSVRFVGEPDKIALQPDGRILVFGIIGPPTREWNYTTGGVLRVLPDGRIDTSFGRDGIAPTPTGLSGAIALQHDGKIVVASTYSFLLDPDVVGPGNGASGIGVARLTPTGALDLAFGTDGLTRIPVDDPKHYTEAARDVAVLDDGSIAVIGGTNAYGLDGSPLGSSSPVVARLLPEGQLDPRFNGTGKKRLDVAGSGGGSAILGDTEGRVVIATMTASSAGAPTRGHLVRLLSTGVLDPTFAGGGRTETPVPVQALARDGQGRIIAAGAVAPESRLHRYSADGALESAAFTWRGFLGAVVPTPVAVAVTPDGRVVTAGITTNNTAAVIKGWDGDWFVQRVTPTK